MANRDARLLTKRTSVPGKVPTGTTGNESSFIQAGELASNLADHSLWGYDGTDVFEYGSNSFLGLTGGTVSGDLFVNGSLSANTLFSGSTDVETIIYNILAGAPSGDITRVQPGTNITTGGTANNPIVNTVDSPSFNNIEFSGTATGGSLSVNDVSASTIYIGGINISGATTSLKTKSGIVSGSSFSGNPDKYAVVFATAFADNNYSVTVTGGIERSWTIESKTAAGFTINSNANPGFSENVFWQAIEVGES